MPLVLADIIAHGGDNGGIKRIARVSEYLVPFMAGAYLLIAFVVLALNITEVPGVIALIVKSAFGLEPAIGGGIGAAIMMGLKRGLFSNEAGLGSAPNVAAVAYVPHPANQGIVQAFSVFIDTVVICSATAFMILLSGIYDPASGNDVAGIALTQAALADHVGEWGRVFVSLALLMFAFSTILYNYYLGENSLNFFSRDNQSLFNVFRIAIVLLVCWGATTDLGTVFGFAAVTMGLLAVVNLIALIFLFGKGLRILRDFDRQVRDGIEFPVFDANQHPDMNLAPASWQLEPEDLERINRKLGNDPDAVREN